MAQRRSAMICTLLAFLLCAAWIPAQALLDSQLVVPLASPIPENLYPLLAVTLISSGLVATASFFVYEVQVSRFTRSVAMEGVMGGAASVLLGFGTLFLFLWTGVYV